MSTETLDKVISIVRKHLKIKETVVVNETTHIINDLDGDSLDAMEIVMILEDEFQILIPEENLAEIKTLGFLANLVDSIKNE